MKTLLVETSKMKKKLGILRPIIHLNKSSDQQEEFVTSNSDKEKEFARAIVSEKLIDYENSWIVDLGCPNCIISDEKKLINMSEYKGGQLVVTINNSRMLITDISKTVFVPQHSSTSKCLPCFGYDELFICLQITASGNYVMFGSNNVKYFCRFPKVVYLANAHSLYICGRIGTDMLSTKIHYAAYLVFKLTCKSYGLEYANSIIRFVNNESKTETEEQANTVQLATLPKIRGDG
ncbi:hypothetical protein T459_30801 [Capsicum annuum]|uniref:Uncharacterized protein n=1 Tax=Capsicum annuum TaxID=4072 RepID=A0A2G2Y9D0_CAPAN|nr:hypothetical protein FXO37_20662 [Capsicum annuum]PHT66376.1 hypothetical protein T459_30801 [Capsicum annuum]